MANILIFARLNEKGIYISCQCDNSCISCFHIHFKCARRDLHPLHPLKQSEVAEVITVTI